MKTAFIIVFLLTIIGCSDKKNIKLIKVSGTVENTLLVAENSWLSDEATLSYEIVTLSNGKKYRISSDQVKGVGKGFNVEILLVENSMPNNKGEYEAYSIKIIAIPIPGSKKKLKYPPSNPPIIINEIEK